MALKASTAAGGTIGSSAPVCTSTLPLIEPGATLPSAPSAPWNVTIAASGLALRGHVQHDATAEAVADGGDLRRVDVRVGLEHRQRGIEPRLHHGRSFVASP